MPDPDRPLRRPGVSPGARVRSPLRDRIDDALRDSPILPTIDRTRVYIDGIFEGGGALGTAYIGSLLALDMHRIWFRRVAGTSAGAITAAMVAAGYRATEIAWLCGPPGALDRVPVPTTLPAAARDMAPIKFLSFIDPPQRAADVMAFRRQTALWQALRMQVIDDLHDVPIAVPTRERTVDDVADALATTFPLLALNRPVLEGILRTGLGFLPTSTPTLGDFGILPTPAALNAFADTVWRGFTDEMDWYPPLVNLLYRGGYARGDTFHETIRQLVAAGMDRSINDNVTMGELPMHLTVIGSNASETSMMVYSSTATPDMPVADAVRASMAIPFFFEPMVGDGNDDIIDGGMFSNYPFWLHTGGGDGAVTDTREDRERPKLGFILDDRIDPPRDWGAPWPPAHDRRGRGLRPSHRQTLEDVLGVPLPDVPIIDRMLAMVDVVLQREKVFNPPLRAAAREKWDFFEAEIPLRGFDWVDFSVNDNPATFASMAFRGWEAVTRTEFFRGQVPEAERAPNPFHDLP